MNVSAVVETPFLLDFTFKNLRGISFEAAKHWIWKYGFIWKIGFYIKLRLCADKKGYSRNQGEKYADRCYLRKANEIRLVMDSGHVILSALQPETISSRFEKENNLIEESEEQC